VVGVILNLTVWFAVHVLFSRVGTLSAGPVHMSVPELASVNVEAAALSAFAFVLIFTLKRGILFTLAACALAALVWSGLTGTLRLP
jgi:chromate transporter